MSLFPDDVELAFRGTLLRRLNRSVRAYSLITRSTIHRSKFSSVAVGSTARHNLAQV